MTELEKLQQDVQTKTQMVGELEETLAGLEEQLRILQEQVPGEVPTDDRTQMACPACGILLTITPPTETMAGDPTMLYCPECGAEVWEAPTAGYTIASGVAALPGKPFYRRWAFWGTVGGITALAAGIAVWKKRKR